MSRLYAFELKKIFQKKAFWVTLIIGLVLNFVAVFSNYFFDTYEYSDGSKIHASEYYKHESEECGKLSGRVIDDAFIDEVRDKVIGFALDKKYVTEQDIEDIKAGKIKESYVVANGTGYTTPLVGLDSAAEQLGIGDAWYFLMDAVNDNAKLLSISGNEFQKVFRDNIVLPENNKAYWKKVADGIENPIVYNYDEPMLYFIDSGFFIVWFIFILIAVSLSGEFADERGYRMDALIASTRKGKMPSAIAKMMAGITVSLAATILVFATTLLACYIKGGKLYPKAIIQMLDPECAQNMTYGNAVMKQFICTMIMAVLFSVVTILLSELMGSTAAMGVQMGILMLSFFNIPLKSELLNNLWTLRPTHYLNYWIENYSVFDFGTLQLNSMQMATVLYLIIAVVIASVTVALKRR